MSLLLALLPPLDARAPGAGEVGPDRGDPDAASRATYDDAARALLSTRAPLVGVPEEALARLDELAAGAS